MRRLPIVIEAPGAACSSPARDRLCMALGCDHNLTRRLGLGQHHSTRCAHDGTDGAPGFARVIGEVRDCARYDACLDLVMASEDSEAAIARSRGSVMKARSCPRECIGFVPTRRRVAAA